jgi:hypothetical protein
MTPKDKAKELVDRFAPLAKYWDCYNNQSLEENNAKLSALITIDEILNALKQSFNQIHETTEMTADLYISESISVHYYQEVKNEIEKL